MYAWHARCACTHVARASLLKLSLLPLSRFCPRRSPSSLPSESAAPAATSTGGEGFIQIGKWRIGTAGFAGDCRGDTDHFSISYCNHAQKTKATSFKFRADDPSSLQRLGTEPRAADDCWHLCDAPLLPGGAANVVLGDRMIEFRSVWRLGVFDVAEQPRGNRLVLSHSPDQGISEVNVGILRKPGTADPTGLTLWNREIGDARINMDGSVLKLSDDWRFAVDERHSAFEFGRPLRVFEKPGQLVERRENPEAFGNA